MKKIITLIMSTLLISACATYQNTRKPENMSTTVLNTDYQSAYKKIRDSFIYECNLAESAISGNVFSNSKTAELNISSQGTYLLSLDLRALSDNKTEMDYYSVHGKGKLFGTISQWVNEGKKGCN